MNHSIRPCHNVLVKMAVIGLLSVMSLAASAQTALRVHGSIYFKLLFDQHPAEMNAAAGGHFEYLANGTDAGVLDLLAGKADVATMVGPLEDVVKKINQQNPGAVDLTKLRSIPLGSAKYVLIVNPNNPVRKVTTQQAAGLLSGRIKNWKEVGGPDQMIVPVVPPMGSGATVTFENLLLRTEKWSPDAHIVGSTVEIRSSVAQSVRSVGTISAAALTDKVVALTLDSDLETPVSLVVLGEPQANALKLADALRPFIK